MVKTVNDLFFHPGTFFAEIPEERTELIWPVIIVVLVSIVNFAGAVVLSPPVTDPFIQYSVTFLSLFAVALATWVVIATGLYLLSRAFSGKGTYLLTLVDTGYGMMPLAFSGLFTFSTIALITQNEAALSSVHPMVLTGIIYGEQLVFTAWAAYLWICGVKNAQKLPTPLAVAVVVIVIAILFALFIILTTILFP